MINIVEKRNCCGCNACGDICPKHAISFDKDIEGFWYPVVDQDKCIDCGLCDRICPELNIQGLKQNDYPKPIKIVAAIHKNMSIRWDSTSGGAFSAFAQHMYDVGGYVSGALYNKDFSVSNYISNNPEDLPKLRSSKYLQSNAEGLYKEIKEYLLKGEKVLACGTPCQMAGLRSYLGKEYANLIIIDFICRGVNSPKVYRKYLDSLESKYGGKVVHVKAKNKELGWRNLTRKIVFDNDKTYYGVKMDDDFRRGYHTNVFCRPSCYSCQYKGFPRIADITIADFWGIEKVDKSLDNNIGTSLILINSNKGLNYFNSANSFLEWKDCEFESILNGNIALTTSISKPSIDRNAFFMDLDKHSFDYVVDKYFPRRVESRKRRILNQIHFYLSIVKVLRMSFSSYYNLIRLNFRRNTCASWKKRRIIYPAPGSVYDIDPTAMISINAPIIYGEIVIKGMRLPTCLKMSKGSSLTINPGPLTRYGNDTYLLRYGAYIEIVNGGKLTLGQGAANVGLTIMCGKEITIGNDVRIGRNVSIRDYNGTHVIINDTYVNHAPVIIEDHVWLCSGCSVLPGVTIGTGSVVAANSTVTKNVPPHCLVAGSPAKIVKTGIEWY